MGSLTSHSIGGTHVRAWPCTIHQRLYHYTVSNTETAQSFEAVVHFYVLLLLVSFFEVYRLSEYDSLSPKPL